MKKILFLAAFSATLLVAQAQTTSISPETVKGTKNAPSGGQAVSLKVGDFYGGGIVFWIDPNSIPTHPQGLCCATRDQSDSIKWAYCFTAAQYLDLEGYSDWIMPSKEELNIMYHALKKAGIGAFSNAIYWSSTGRDDDSAWYQDFSNGDQSYFRSEKSRFHFRAIRYF